MQEITKHFENVLLSAHPEARQELVCKLCGGNGKALVADNCSDEESTQHFDRLVSSTGLCEECPEGFDLRAAMQEKTP